MGDRTLQTVKVAKSSKSRTVHGLWEDGHVAGRVLTLPGNRILMLAWNRFSLIMLESWIVDSWLYRDLWNEWECDPMSKFLKNVKAAKKIDKDASHAATDKEFAKDHPAICEFMTLRKDDSGTIRKTSSLLIFCEDGQWKACLSEREEELTLWASADSLAGLLEALEATLQSPTPQWRTSSGKRKSGSK
jgi:hypothetical protein